MRDRRIHSKYHRRPERWRLRKELEGIDGTRLRGVRYCTLPYLAEERYVRFGNLHDVSMGVELKADDGRRITVSWITEDLDARLAIDAGTIAERFPGRDLAELDVTDWDEWQELVGCAMREATVLSGFKPADDGLTQVGVRLGFDGGRTVTLALGEVRPDGQLAYSANNLVVLFEPVFAQRYVTSLAEEA